MRNLFFLLFCLIFLFSCRKKNTHYQVIQHTSPVQYELNKIQFLTPQIGFICGGERYQKSIILTTYDGGNTWTEALLPTNAQQKQLYGLALNNLTGQIISVGYGGCIYTSNDSGQHWIYYQHPLWVELQNIAYKNTDTFITCGGKGFQAGTLSNFSTNGNLYGHQEKNYELCDIQFLNNEVAYASGFGAIIKTIDGGNHWEFTTAKNDYFKAIDFINANEGIAVGNNGSILKTEDGGNTWSIKRNAQTVLQQQIHLQDIARGEDKTLVAVGDNGVVISSIDGGNEWNILKSFTKTNFKGITYFQNNTFFLVGEKGSIFELQLSTY